MNVRRRSSLGERLASPRAAAGQKPTTSGPTATPVPRWVKAACCGPDDAHHLRPDQVHRVSDDYYMVDGYRYRIPARDALPSQDGDYWIFYRDGEGGNQSIVYCFFVPMNF